MEYIHYDNYALVKYQDNTYPLYNTTKKNVKTRTLTNQDGFKVSVKVEDIRISPKTYWHTSSHYDHQFDGHDANCWLCGWYGIDYSTCKCKKTGFTIDEHTINVPKARRRFLKTVFNNYFKPYVKLVKIMSNDKINDLLYAKDKYGNRILRLYLPSWSNRQNDVERMKIYLNTKL